MTPRSLPIRAALAALLAAMLLFVGAPARADGPDESPERVAEARAEYARGNELGKKEDWAEALAAFQRSYQLKPHPTTRYNIGTCLRVLGQYTAARGVFEEVLHTGSVEQLPGPLVENARGYKAEIERLVAHVVITIEPADAAIAFDGRPLEPSAEKGEGGIPVAIAGVHASGPGTPIPARTFEAIVDPGTRVIVISQKGYHDIVRTERFAPGSRTKLALDLQKLPASLHITANVDRPIVTVNGVDVGNAPVVVPRLAGEYRVVVSKEGYVPHEMTVKVASGQDPKLDATLVPETTPITKRWWFWAGALAIVAGGVAITYAATRPEPQPPEYQRGNTGWLVELGR